MDDIAWLNAKDSLLHALDHFVELRGVKNRRWHHQKWAIISVHHAASCLVVQWLRDADASHRLLVTTTGTHNFPHLEEAIKALRKFSGTIHLTKAENYLLLLLKNLNDIRNAFMHRLPPDQIDKKVIAFAATSMIGLLHSVSRRLGKDFYDLFGEFPEIRQCVVEAMHYSEVEEYYLYIESLLAEQYKPNKLQQCPSCAAHAVNGSSCEACFEELESVFCERCEQNFHALPYELRQGGEQECPSCGWRHRGKNGGIH